VDDELDSRKFISFVLEQAGASVTAVSSAIAALEIFARLQPDVLISDIGMPDVDGYALIRQIRQMPQGERILAVALTAYAGESDQHQAIAAGFQFHLSKPVDPDAIIAAIVHSHERQKGT
jgi:CheY-like chemotaxis protein